MNTIKGVNIVPESISSQKMRVKQCFVTSSLFLTDYLNMCGFIEDDAMVVSVCRLFTLLTETYIVPAISASVLTDPQMGDIN